MSQVTVSPNHRERMNLRVPAKLKAKIRDRAASNRRSINEEVVFILERVLAGQPHHWLDTRAVEGLRALEEGRTVTDDDFDDIDWDLVPDDE